MSTFKITIPFTPKAKASVRGKGKFYYNPSARGMLQTRKWVESQLKDRKTPLFKGPLLAIVHYQIPAPLGLIEKRRKPQHGKPHIKRPDGDNLEKFLNDSLNGIVWSDDSNIAWLVRSKSLTSAREGQTVIFVRQLENDLPDYDLIMSDIEEHIYFEVNDESNGTGTT